MLNVVLRVKVASQRERLVVERRRSDLDNTCCLSTVTIDSGDAKVSDDDEVAEKDTRQSGAMLVKRMKAERELVCCREAVVILVFSRSDDVLLKQPQWLDFKLPDLPRLSLGMLVIAARVRWSLEQKEWSQQRQPLAFACAESRLKSVGQSIASSQPTVATRTTAEHLRNFYTISLIRLRTDKEQSASHQLFDTTARAADTPQQERSHIDCQNDSSCATAVA